jgi:hypothetical protein
LQLGCPRIRQEELEVLRYSKKPYKKQAAMSFDVAGQLPLPFLHSFFLFFFFEQMFKLVVHLALAAQCAHALNVIWQDPRCDAHRALIEEELQLASDMALAASKDVEKGSYYENMFGPTSRQRTEFKGEVKQTFEQIAKMVTGDDPTNPLEITCDPQSRFCKQKTYMAHMSDSKRIMNFCDQFFATGSEIKGTNAREKDDCQSMTLREAHRSKASVLVHEMTHTRAAMLYEDP